MKKLFSCSLMAICVLLMTSCLDGGSNQSSGVGYGVIGYSSKTGKTIIKTGGVPVYSAEVAASSNIQLNDCCAFAYTLDGDIPENSEEAIAANGYYTVTVSQYADIDKYSVTPYLKDTTLIEEKELTVVSTDMGILKNYDGSIVFIDNKFFLGTYHDGFSSEQKQTLNISFNPDQEPEVVNGDNVYDLFLRVVKTEDGKSSLSQTTQLLNVFDMTSFLNSFEYKEKQASKKSIKFRVNYINTLNEDKTKVTWKSSDVATYVFPVDE